MKTKGTRPGIARFRSEHARQKFLTAYDAAFATWPVPYHPIDVETHFGTTRVYRSGPNTGPDTDTGPPIVLLHGHGNNAATWYPQIAALAARNPVYAIDNIDDPGRSVARRPLTGSADYARWLDEVLDGLGLTSVHLAGHSYGGWLSLNHAVYGPSRLASVTALDPAGLEKVTARFILDCFVGLLRLVTRKHATPRLARLTANAALLADWRVMRPVLIGTTSFGPQRSGGRRYDDEELAAITVPLTVVMGARTTLFNPRSATERLRRLVPHARVVVVPGAGHGVPLEDADAVNAAILDNVNRAITP